MSNLKNIIKCKNHPSILLYSSETRNCKNTNLNVLNDLYDINTKTNNLTFRNINYEKSIYHYYIDLKNLNFSILNDLLKKIIKHDNYYININKIIILDNFKLFGNYQKHIKNLIEKNMNIKFIILTSHYDMIYNGLKNLLLNLSIKNIDIEIEYVGNILYNNDLYNDLFIKINNILKHKFNKTILKEIKSLSYLLVLNNIEIKYLYNILFDIFIVNKKNILEFNLYIIDLVNNKNIIINNLLLYYEYILISCCSIMNS